MANYVNWFNGNFNKVVAIAFLSSFLAITAWGLNKIIDIPTTLSNYVLKTDFAMANTTLSTKINIMRKDIDSKFEATSTKVERRLEIIDGKVDEINKYLRDIYKNKINIPEIEGSDVKK